jgi:hypothetical protein
LVIGGDIHAFVDVAATDDIGRLPDRNVAEVIEHLPGVGNRHCN